MSKERKQKIDDGRIFQIVSFCRDIFYPPYNTFSPLFSVKRSYSSCVTEQLIKIMTLINVGQFCGSAVVSAGGRARGNDLTTLCHCVGIIAFVPSQL